MARKNVGKSENNPYRMASAHQDNVKEKVQSVREVVGQSKSTNEIILVLQYFDYNVESTIQAYLEDHAQAALTEWHCPNNKVVSKRKKKNKPKATANHQAEPGSSDQSGSSTPVIPAQAEQESLKRVQAPLPQRDKGGRKAENTASLTEQPNVPSIVPMTTTSITSTKTISNGRSSDKIENHGVSISTVTSIAPSMHASPVVSSSSVSMTTAPTHSNKTLDLASMTPSVVKLGNPVSIETSAVSKAIIPVSIENSVSRKRTPVSVEAPSASKKTTPVSIATELICDKKQLESSSSLSVSSTKTLTSSVLDVPTTEPLVHVPTCITMAISTNTAIVSLASVSDYSPVTRPMLSVKKSQSPSILTTSTTTTMTVTTTKEPVKSSSASSAAITSLTSSRDIDRSTRSNNNPRSTTSSKSARAKQGSSGPKRTALTAGSGKRKDSERDVIQHNPSNVDKPASSKDKQHEHQVAGTDRSIQRSISAQSASSTGSSASSRSKKPHAGIERSLKDLTRHSVMLDRMHTVLNDEVEKSSKRIKSVFDEIRLELQRREKMMREQLEAVKKQGNEQFNERKEKVLDLRMHCERAEVMKERELAELRLDIKHLIADRRIDEDLGRTTRFLYDSDHMINEVKKFGEVVPACCPYYGRGTSVNSSISESGHDVTSTLNTSMDSAVSGVVNEPKMDGGVVSDSDSATTTSAASTVHNTNNSNSGDLHSAQEMVVIQTRLRNSLRQQGWSINSPPKRFKRPAFANQQQNTIKTRIFENSANSSAPETGAKSKNPKKMNRQQERQWERQRESNVTNSRRSVNTDRAQTSSGLQNAVSETIISSSAPGQHHAANQNVAAVEQGGNNSAISTPIDASDSQTMHSEALLEMNLTSDAVQHDGEEIPEMEDMRSENMPINNKKRFDWALSVEEEERKQELMDGSGDYKTDDQSLMRTQNTSSESHVMYDFPKAQRSRRQNAKTNSHNNNDTNNNADNIEKYNNTKPNHVKNTNNIKINNDFASNKGNHGDMDKHINSVKTMNEDMINGDLSRPKKTSATVSVNGTMDTAVKVKRVEVVVNGDCDEGYDASES